MDTSLLLDWLQKRSEDDSKLSSPKKTKNKTTAASKDIAKHLENKLTKIVSDEKAKSCDDDDNKEHQKSEDDDGEKKTEVDDKGDGDGDDDGDESCDAGDVSSTGDASDVNDDEEDDDENDDEAETFLDSLETVDFLTLHAEMRVNR